MDSTLSAPCLMQVSDLFKNLVSSLLVSTVTQKALAVVGPWVSVDRVHECVRE